MKKTITFFSRRATMMLLAMLLTMTAQTAWADELTGSGTEAEPYLITSTADWDLFCSWMNAGTNTGSFYRLTEDISVTTMSGGSITSHRLNGTFDGDGHTITVNYGSAETPLTEDYAAPFRYIQNATIKNLHVTGNIYTSMREAAGLVAGIWTNGSVNISTCWSSVVINGTREGLSRYAGLISLVTANGPRTVTITDCFFDGQLLGNGNSTYCGGFVGGNAYNVVFTNCLFAPSAPTTVGTEDNYTFWYIGDKDVSGNLGTATLDHCYYKTALGTPQGTDASGMTDEQLVEALGNMWELKDGKISLRIADFGTRMDFATVEGILPAYKYTGNTIDLGAYTVKNYYGTALTEDVDYSVTLKRDGAVASEVKEEGLYSLELSGISTYTGTKVIEFMVATYPDELSVDPDYKCGEAGMLYVNMPSGNGSIDFTGYSPDISFKIYDDGGKNNNYSQGWNSTYTVKAPAGYAVKLTGTVDALKAKNTSYLTVYNGTETTEANRIGNEQYGTNLPSEDIGTLVSGQTMTLKFTSANTETTLPGLDLTVQWAKDISTCTAEVPNQSQKYTHDEYEINRDLIWYKFDDANNYADVASQTGVVVKDGNTPLTLGTDYRFHSVRYDDGTAEGLFGDPEKVGDKCLLVIEGMGNYAGKLYAPFRIIVSDANGTMGDLKWVYSDGTLTISKKDDVEGNVAMPDGNNYDDFDWKEVASGVFTLTIDEGITKVGNFAFGSKDGVEHYGNLTTINLPNSLTEIGENAFAYCGGLTVNLDDILAKNIKLDNRAFYQIGCLTGSLANNANNDTKIDLLDQARSNDVTLSDRTLYKDGDWNTLTLPFAVSDFTGTLFEDATVKELLTTSNLNNGTLTLNFSDNLTAIEAGKPYIVKWAKPDGYDVNPTTYDIVNPRFAGVTISSTTPTAVNFTGGSFVGNYAPLEITDANRDDVVLLAAGNKLGYAKTDRTIANGKALGAFRAYLNIPAVAGAPAISSYELNFGDDDATGIILIDNSQFSQRECGDARTIDNSAGAWYSLDVRKLDGKPTQKGLYINNGRKVVVK